ncbi:RHS repeat-associated core domain-containing protein [Schlesneria sp. DSM 10557]|uniref:RHS repeat-associated core domain-containing protein n=1 Tax=Schlesneria sp. DSM 10557 TaxID=3044399 RepID=UPI0035A091A1
MVPVPQPQPYGNLVSQQRNGQSTFYHFDGLGSTAALTTSTQTVSDSYTYRAFGDIAASSGTTTNPYQWVGREGYYRDEEAAELNLGHRHYDTATGRFTTEDPIGYHSGDSNFYRYGGNNPIVRTDPSGLAWNTWGSFGYSLLIEQPAQAVYNLPGNVYRGGRSLVTGEAGRALGDRVLQIQQKGSQRDFTGSLADYGNFARNITGEMVGTNRLAEGIAGADLATEESLTGEERIIRGASGVSQVAGTVAGGLSSVKAVAGKVTAVQNAKLPVAQQVKPVLQFDTPLPGSAALDPLVSNLREAALRLTPKRAGKTPVINKIEEKYPNKFDTAAEKARMDPVYQQGPRGNPKLPAPNKTGPAASKPLIGNAVDSIPSVRNDEFNRWFNKLTPDELDEIWKNPKLRDAIEDRLRHPGGLHEWHLVARTPTFKRWGLIADQIKEMRNLIKDTEFVNPVGRHGGKGSTVAHNELLEIIDSSTNYEQFVRRLQNWANYRLKGGVNALPSGLRPQ